MGRLLLHSGTDNSSDEVSFNLLIKSLLKLGCLVRTAFDDQAQKQKATRIPAASTSRPIDLPHNPSAAGLLGRRRKAGRGFQMSASDKALSAQQAQKLMKKDGFSDFSDYDNSDVEGQ